jgi:SAM-dependent methyltransferase
MPNEEQIRYWNQRAGERWVALSEQLDFQLGPFGRAAMDRARIERGARVLDVGCGCGDTTLELARRVGAGGNTIGVDVSAPMLELARARAAAAAVPNAEFELADAQSYAPPRTTFDVVFSRFGVMFFEDPEAALHHLLGLLRPGGRLAFVCWRELDDNPWLSVPLEAASRHLELPPAPEATAPGPFAFARREYVAELLDHAGFVSIASEPVNLELDLAAGRGLEAAVDFTLATGPVARAVEQANLRELGPITSSLRRALSAYARNQNVRLAASSWLFTAERLR